MPEASFFNPSSICCTACMVVLMPPLNAEAPTGVSGLPLEVSPISGGNGGSEVGIEILFRFIAWEGRGLKLTVVEVVKM